MTEISRRELLTSAAVTGGGLAAASLWPAAAFGERTSRLTPFDLHFTTTHQYRPFDLIGRRFTQYSARAGSTSRLVRTRVGPAAPFATVILDVAGTPAGGRVAAGLVEDVGHGGGHGARVRWPHRGGVMAQTRRP